MTQPLVACATNEFDIAAIVVAVVVCFAWVLVTIIKATSR